MSLLDDQLEENQQGKLTWDLYPKNCVQWNNAVYVYSKLMDIR